MTEGTATHHLRETQINLLNHFCLALDNCDWDLLANLFTDDAVFTVRRLQDRRKVTEDPISCLGREELVKLIVPVIESLAATHHMVSNFIVDLADDRRSARASCHFRAYHAGAGERAHLFEESLGLFSIETVAIDDGWRIKRMDETIMIVLGSPEAFGVHPEVFDTP